MDSLPTAERARIEENNRSIAEVLDDSGDVPTIVREVSHWVDFPDKVSRKEGQALLEAKGFREIQRSEDGAEGRPSRLIVATDSEVTLDGINATTFSIAEQMLAHGGRYVTWETSVCC